MTTRKERAFVMAKGEVGRDYPGCLRLSELLVKFANSEARRTRREFERALLAQVEAKRRKKA